MKAKNKEKEGKSFWEKINIAWCYVLLGIAVVVHIVWILLSKSGSPINELDAHISFDLLMFALIMASFVPMLTYSYTLKILKEVKDGGAKDELWGYANKFYDMINFVVNQSSLLITISILLGCFAFMETRICSNIVTRRFLIGYYIWYFVVAIVWSALRVWVFLRKEEKGKEEGMEETKIKCKNQKKKEKKDRWRRYIGYYRRYIGYYLWILCYIGISIFLLRNYLNEYPCSNSTVWLEYSMIVTCLWLLSFSILWIIPSDIYYPLWRLKKEYSRTKKKTYSNQGSQE